MDGGWQVVGGRWQVIGVNGMSGGSVGMLTGDTAEDAGQGIAGDTVGAGFIPALTPQE